MEKNILKATLVRHGDTEYLENNYVKEDESSVFMRPIDLTEIGTASLEETAEKIVEGLDPQKDIVVLWSSPAWRAQDSEQIIERKIREKGVPIHKKSTINLMTAAKLLKVDLPPLLLDNEVRQNAGKFFRQVNRLAKTANTEGKRLNIVGVSHHEFLNRIREDIFPQDIGSGKGIQKGEHMDIVFEYDKKRGNMSISAKIRDLEVSGITFNEKTLKFESPFMDTREKVPVIRHLEDVDNLFFGADNVLRSGQESVAEHLSVELAEYIQEHQYKQVLFLTSPKQRALETALMVKNNLLDSTPELRVHQKVVNDLQELYQGKYILPAEYKPGEKFQGLVKAKKIFTHEVFEDGTDTGNLLYEFGSAYEKKNSDNEKYPEMKDYFSESGECYAELAVRVFKQVIAFYRAKERLGSKQTPVIFTHNQIGFMLNNLTEACHLIKANKSSFQHGTLCKLCWELWKKGSADGITYGHVSYLCPPELSKANIDILIAEVAWLENLLNS